MKWVKVTADGAYKCSACHKGGWSSHHPTTIKLADRHATECDKIKLELLHEEIADLRAHSTRLSTDLLKVMAARDRYRNALESCEAAYASERAELLAERDMARSERDSAIDERDELRKELEMASGTIDALRHHVEQLLEEAATRRGDVDGLGRRLMVVATDDEPTTAVCDHGCTALTAVCLVDHQPVRPPKLACTVNGCDQEAIIKGLCAPHYNGRRKPKPQPEPQPEASTTEPEPAPEPPAPEPEPKAAAAAPTLCTFPECGRKHRAKGYCSGHYFQFNAGRELTPLRKRVEKKPRARKPRAVEPCSFDPCDRPGHTKGLCRGHYQQHLKGKPLKALQQRKTREPAPEPDPEPAPEAEETCRFDGCDRPVWNKGRQLCSGHYSQLRRGKELVALGTVRRLKPAPKPEPEKSGPAVLRSLLGNKAAWVGDALCAQVDPELWFPEKGGDASPAKRICRKCPVRKQCLEEALATGERHGIFGGLSERERMKLKRARERAAAA